MAGVHHLISLPFGSKSFAVASLCWLAACSPATQVIDNASRDVNTPFSVGDAPGAGQDAQADIGVPGPSSDLVGGSAGDAQAAPDVISTEDAGLPDGTPAKDTGTEDSGDVGPLPDTTPPAKPKIVINEVMYRPTKASDELGEWLELYNAGTVSVDLKDWVIRDKAQNLHKIASSVALEPGGYVVLGRNGDFAKNGAYVPDYVYAEFFLANSADSIVLVDSKGAIVDEVSYKVDAPWPSDTIGRSIELQDATADNSKPESWAAATAVYGLGDRGTPGQKNGGPVAPFTLDPAVGDWQSPELKATLRFSPKDDAEPHVLETLAQAKTQLRLAYFNIRHDAVLDLLKTLKADGIDIDILMDKAQQDLDYNDMDEKLAAAGIPFTLIDKSKAEFATMHDKFTVIDGHLLFTGSANLSITALNKSDEDLLTIDDVSIAQRFLQEFDEIKAGGNAKSAAYAPGDVVRAWMGPEDDLDQKVKERLDAATGTVVVAQFQLNQKTLVAALIAAKDRGVKVVVVLDQVQAATETADEDLVAKGIPVILAKNTLGEFSEMHSKFAVIDHKTVIMGSFNWTSLATYYNDENMVIIDDAGLAARAEGKLAELLTTYAPGKDPATLGLHVGEVDVTLSTSNVTLEAGGTLTVFSLGAGPFAPPKALAGTTLTVALKTGTRLEYRYLIAGPSGAVTEGGLPHVFTVPFAPGPFVVKDAFRK